MYRNHPLALIVLLLVAVTPLTSFAKEFSDQAVEAAIKKGVDYLWSRQNSDGSWPPHGTGTASTRDRMGYSALPMYALLQAGADLSDPRVQKGLEWLAKTKSEATYSLGIRANVWLTAAQQDRKYISLLRKDAKTLALSTKHGGYRYISRGEHRSDLRSSDKSASQYGVLGVWAGARASIEIPQEYWWLVTQYWVRDQNGDGGWGYQTGRASSRTMSAAGVATMFVCFDNLMSAASSFVRCDVDEQAQLAMKPMYNGLEWFDKRYGGYRRGDPHYYFLYGIERVGLASGYKYFGKYDWYRIGVQKLLSHQKQNGMWEGSRGGTISTAFALLFLARGSNPVLFNKLEFDGDWNNRPRDMAVLTRWISHVFEETVNWQIINFEAPVPEWHDAPILYLSGSRKPEFTDEQIQKLRDYVHQGGTIFSVAEGRRDDYREGIRQWLTKIYPEYELTEAPEDHPLYNIYYDLKPKQVKFYVLSNGARPLVIHTDNDLSVDWQLKRMASNKESFEAAANVFMYVTDKRTGLRPRGTTLWPERVRRFNAKKTLTLARLRHDGNYDPEPLAYERFRRLMAHEHRIKVNLVDPIAIDKLPEQSADLAVLVGTDAIKLNDNEKNTLKQYVENGGTLLFDAAGGDIPGSESTGFYDSVEKILGEMFPDKSLMTLSSAAPLYRIDGMTIDKVRWRRGTKVKMGGVRNPTLRAILIGDRPAVLVSRQDITVGLVGTPAYSVYGYYQGNVKDPGTAFDLMRNIAVKASEN